MSSTASIFRWVAGLAWLLLLLLAVNVYWWLPGIALGVALAMRSGSGVGASLRSSNRGVVEAGGSTGSSAVRSNAARLDRAIVSSIPLGIALLAVFVPISRVLRIPFKEGWLVLSLFSLVVLIREIWQATVSNPEPWPVDTSGPLGSTATTHRPVGSDESSSIPWWSLAFAAVAIALYVLPSRHLLAPAGDDMAMHSTFARLLIEHRLVPTTQDPIYPGVPLGVYPLGFHAAQALAGWGRDLLRAGVLTMALTHAFTSLALFLCIRPEAVRRRSETDVVTGIELHRGGPGFGAIAAALAALVCALMARDPQAFAGWGGNPSVLGILLAMVALRRLLWPTDASPTSERVVTALLVAGVATIHPGAGLCMAYAYIVARIWMLGLPRRQSLRDELLRLLVIGAIAVVLVAPQLSQLRDVSVSTDELAWTARGYEALPYPGSEGWLGYWGVVFGDGFMLTFAACAIFNLIVRRQPGIELRVIGVLISVEILAHLGGLALLPGGFAMYQGWLMLFALPAMALVVFRCFQILLRSAQWPTGRPLRRFAAGTMILVVFIVAMERHDRYFGGGWSRASVTSVDLEAYRWIEENVPMGTLIDTNKGDGGRYIPAATGRPVSAPMTTPVWFEEMHECLAAIPTGYVYVGGKLTAGDDLTSGYVREENIVFSAERDGARAIVATSTKIPDRIDWRKR